MSLVELQSGPGRWRCGKRQTEPPSSTVSFMRTVKFTFLLMGLKHHLPKARNAYNSITILIGLNGFEASSPEDIGNLAVSHFQETLGPTTHTTSPALISQVAALVRTDRFSCSPEQAIILSRIPSPEDITKTMFRLNQNKSPGPDGYTSVSRLKPLLPNIILPNQTAFIKGRLLIENCLLAAEIVSGYHRQNGRKKLTLKIDIAKAFDSVRWDFLTACLEALNLPADYITWLPSCYSTPTYSVGINGRLHGYFNGTRGLRQGDPLSPYLFGIVMNTLSQKLNEAAQTGRFGFHPNCQESGLTHLCFADDILIFTDGSSSSVQGVLQVLEEFKAFSGLSISVEKSCFFSSGLTESETSTIVSSSGIPLGSLPVRYLGLPLNSKKLSLANSEPLLQQIRTKISAWTTKYLSFAGRQVPISTVIAGITNFWCGAFELPKECISAIDKMCNAFLWKGTLEGKYVARVAWEKVTQPKQSGGLGLRNLGLWNQTCTIKLLWLLLFKTESIWVAWIHQNVIKDDSIWQMKPKQQHTWIFKQILAQRQTSIQWVQIDPGNGVDVNFWFDPWTKFGRLIKFLGPMGPRLTGIPLTTAVAELWRDGAWALRSARSHQMEELLIYLTTISLSDSSSFPQWLINGKIQTSFKSTLIYHSLVESPTVPWYPLIWIKRGIPKHKSLAWLMLLNRCPTRDRLLSWGLNTDPLCLLCNQDNESRDHIYFNCSYSSAVWNHFSSRFAINSATNTWDDITNSLQSQSISSKHKYLSILTWQATVYDLWWERNDRLHRGNHRSTDLIIAKISATIKNKISALRPQNNSLASELMQYWFLLFP
ncbi:PREDICTED: uncharacterized protein LOC106319794 [Brassica oleracea var. oleracea]|uniref:uncharacterized protein LOC106319794 n=1 Tax=Brassica oleracea var. oleracea TaxID=109376 RepID=UPI0006A74DBB|nr:PREDICTED: uncharacterized protein LOC106319794 [Brassica oleracea var. oleracea]